MFEMYSNFISQPNLTDIWGENPLYCFIRPKNELKKYAKYDRKIANVFYKYKQYCKYLN